MDYTKMFRRNIGFLTEEDQKKVSQLSAGIAGAGGDGGLLAERLVRFGRINCVPVK
jgi:tRNA A37 threonylcarbamoyladenosine dehydratase